MHSTIFKMIFCSIILFFLNQALASASQQRQRTSPAEVGSIKNLDSLEDPTQPVMCSVAKDEDLTSDTNLHDVLHRRVTRRPNRLCDIDLQHADTSSILPARECKTVGPIQRRSTYGTYLQHHHVQIEIHDPIALRQ